MGLLNPRDRDVVQITGIFRAENKKGCGFEGLGKAFCDEQFT
jgi:hypothetical protein